MNYDEVAAKIASQIKSYGESQIEHNIAAALRRAANEAAWNGYGLGIERCDEYEQGAFDKCMTARDKMIAKYGPQPTQGEPR